MKKSIVLISLLIIAIAMIVLGCTGSNNSGSLTVTPAPAATGATTVPAGSVATVPAIPSVAPAVNSSVTAATSNISAGVNATNSTYIDPSIVDITNETDESVPNLG
jgi:PBP1b-binding outer membrane lipoprotein LpoB